MQAISLGGATIAKQEANVNRAIRAREVRVVADDGEQLGILSLSEALSAAEERGLDLVEVSPNAVPPVCRIMDFGKYKYQASKRAAEAKKKTARVELKEVKMRPKTEEHDFQFKVKNARRFLEDGNKVKVTIMFRGREVTHPEFGRKLLEKVAEEIKDIGVVESNPSMFGRFMTMIVAPHKK
jgi:translation initiation factor IF-3